MAGWIYGLLPLNNGVLEPINHGFGLRRYAGSWNAKERIGNVPYYIKTWLEYTGKRVSPYLKDKFPCQLLIYLVNSFNF
jgi:hypothetical protein